MSVEVAIETAREENTMIPESVKALLGEELVAQVETAVKGKGKDGKDVDLVIGNDGSFVPADKHEGEKQRAASAEKALRAAAEAVKSMGGTGDPAKLEADVAAVKATTEELKSGHKKEIAAIQKSTAVRMALAGKAHDPADVLALLDLKAVEIGEDGSLKTDLETLLNPIQTAKPYLFKEETPAAPPLSGAKPGEPGGGNAAAKPMNQMTYTELCAFMEQNPGAQI